jgi:uncharacterized RDD family membrane protein YckC
MNWYYAQGGKQMGPVEESALDGLISAGVVRDDTLVWHEGMAAWQTHAAVRGPRTGIAAPFPPAVPAFTGVRYAGFWIRFLARLIDGMLLGMAGLILRLPLMLMLGIGLGRGYPFGIFTPAYGAVTGMLILVNLALGMAYEVYFVSTRGATPGKMALGLKIIRADGSPIPPGLALGRYFAHWISGAILFIGYIMAGFDSQKRALHDRICETRVIYAR